MLSESDQYRERTDGMGTCLECYHNKTIGSNSNRRRDEIVEIVELKGVSECPSSSPLTFFRRIPKRVRSGSPKLFPDVVLQMGDHQSPNGIASQYSSGTISGTKRLRFHPNVTVKFIPSRYELSPKEEAASWLSAIEFQTIRNRCLKQIRKLQQGKAFKNIKFCARGLEAHVGAKALVKAKNRSLAIQSVLEEQERQWQLAATDTRDLAIALVYHHVSSSAQLWANAVGLQDQKVAEELLDDWT